MGERATGDWIDLTAEDGHRFKAWRATPDKPRGAVLVLQEIFGVNSHIREVTGDFAAQGYDAIAPALFDRIERDVELGYEADDVARGRALRGAIATDDTVRDMAAACRAVAGSGKIGAVGYCWGGTLAWLCATRLNVACAVGYYGSGTIDFIGEQPACPVTLMLGEKDQSFPPENIAAIRKAHPGVTVFTYPAGHGFSCDHRSAYDAASTAQARERTLDVFTRYLG